MKKISTLILLLVSISLFAKEVPRETAIKAATFFYKERCANMSVQLTSEPNVKTVYAEKSNGNTLYYIINYDKGFVVIAANDASTPILGYSLDQQLDKQNSSPALIDWFTIYESSLKEIYKLDIKATPEIQAEWSRITNADSKIRMAKTGTPVVLPLLTSTWNQDQFYNERCPFDSMSVSGFDWHVPNGCVALSTAQAMYYNRFPFSGTSSKGYTHPTYGYQYANFATTTYDWNAMTDVVTNYNYNVAQLIYQIGVAVMMDYAVDGSGSQTDYAAIALKQYFGYSQNVALKNKTSYPDINNWISLFKGQLDQKHVMINSGSTQASGGHAFNCDGYDDANYFHFNFGWAGYGNGYYLLTSLTPQGSDFSQNQKVVINVYPASTPVACIPNTTLTARNGSLEDGSRSAQYANDLDCQWLIAPEEATSISFTFSRINTEAGADSVVFYAGETTSDPQIASFSGSTLPETFTINSPKVLVRFLTNSSVVGEGWLINYSSTVDGSYCSSTKVLNTATGTVADGSATSKYHNNTYCKWFIQPSGAANITLTFTEFDLSTDDQLYVFNRTNSTNPHLISILTGSTLPSAIYCPSGKLGLVFQADNKNIANGFSANWTSSASGINEINGVENIVLYPNPASSSLNIEMKLDRSFTGNINILDACGRLVYTSNVKTDAGTFSHSVDVSNLSAGFYLVNFNDEQGQRISMKFSKQ